MASYTKEECKRIEEKWHKRWQEEKAYEVKEDPSIPKFYVLDMFPYPSGAGLHVGHPLGYIASDIIARYKRIKGFNVLHPMGFDAFGLPAEQYAIEYGVHPAVSTRKNMYAFRKQLNSMGLSYDWSREVQTCDPNYYKWTQWIFLQFFNSRFNPKTQKAESITKLTKQFEQEGNANCPFPDSSYRLEDSGKTTFSAKDWETFTSLSKQQIIMQYRMAYLAYTSVNWCKALGTVLANDEVINGVSYRGGHPVVKRKMRQWHLRITAYAERLLKGLEKVDYSHSMKEIQRNWIGKSMGAEIRFDIKKAPQKQHDIAVFTTRPDTIFGTDFLVLAPEHEQVEDITTPEYRQKITTYLHYVESRSEVDRMAEVKKITGCFTGAYAINPLSKKEIPIWVSEYVLMGYGTGAIMGVPCSDERDHRFAKHFGMAITNIIGKHYNGLEANATHEAVLENSDFINGLKAEEAIPKVTDRLEKTGSGKRKINYKMRDAGWSRQRYWGEPFPVIYDENNMPYALKEEELPLKLPNTDDFKSSGTGEGPLSRLKEWMHPDNNHCRDSNTMPTHAGAAWYFLRYMDPHNKKVFARPETLRYWNQVDIYVGGSEHAVAHLLYARLTVKVLHDLGYINFDEPFKKLINQGKIMGDSRLVYRIQGVNKFVSAGLKEKYKTDPLRVDINIVNGVELDLEAFKKWKPDLSSAEFILENGKYLCGTAVEKMSKSYFNIVSPDAIIESHGADTLRMYEMFLGPLKQSKPWNTNGIEGVYKFLRKFWNLFHDDNGNRLVSDENPSQQELKVLHKTLQKIEWDIENLSFNTSVSEFMICANQLTLWKCNKRSILKPLTIALSPFAPHITAELWEKLGCQNPITSASYPQYDQKYLVEDTFDYPIAFNGKVRTQMRFALDSKKEDIEKSILSSQEAQKWIKDNVPKKVIIVPGKIVNVVL